MSANANKSSTTAAATKSINSNDKEKICNNLFTSTEKSYLHKHLANGSNLHFRFVLAQDFKEM